MRCRHIWNPKAVPSTAYGGTTLVYICAICGELRGERRRRGRVLPIVLVLGGLLLLAAVGAFLVNDRQEEGATEATSTSSEPSSSTPAPTTVPSTVVTRTGADSLLSGQQIAAMLERAEQQAHPERRVGDGYCPGPEPYKVEQVITCVVVVEGSNIRYLIRVGRDRILDSAPTNPVIDSQEAAALVAAEEGGAMADCGTPRFRQVNVGHVFTCRTVTSTWEVVVGEGGKISLRRR